MNCVNIWQHSDLRWKCDSRSERINRAISALPQNIKTKFIVIEKDTVHNLVFFLGTDKNVTYLITTRTCGWFDGTKVRFSSVETFKYIMILIRATVRVWWRRTKAVIFSVMPARKTCATMQSFSLQKLFLFWFLWFSFSCCRIKN